MMRSALPVVLALMCLLVSHPTRAQEHNSPAKRADSSVQSIDGGAGPCSVHVEYGFAGARRLDLEAYTGNDGKVKFTGLPARVHRPPLQFKASKDALAGTAVYNPEAECNAEHEIILTRKTQDQN